MWEDVNFCCGTGFLSNHATSKTSSENSDCREARALHVVCGEECSRSWEEGCSLFCCKISISAQVSLSPMRTGTKLDKPDWFSICRDGNIRVSKTCNRWSVLLVSIHKWRSKQINSPQRKQGQKEPCQFEGHVSSTTDGQHFWCRLPHEEKKREFYMLGTAQQTKLETCHGYKNHLDPHIGRQKTTRSDIRRRANVDAMKLKNG